MRSFLDFAELIRPMTPETFFSEYYGRNPCLIEGDGSLYGTLFGWEDVTQFLEMSSVWSAETLKLVLDERTLDPSEYCRRTAGRDGVAVMRPQPKLINAWMDKGASVVFNCVEHMHPGIRAVTEAIGIATNCMVSANIYCSYAGHQAFRSHFDHTDVFVLQVSGTKNWNVYEGRFREPVEAEGFYFPSFDDAYHKQTKGMPKMKPVLSAGDFMYLPKGQYHDACATDGPSLHMTFATTQARGVDFLRTIINSLVEVPEFRAALPDFDDVAAHDAQINLLADKLRDILLQPEIAAQMRDDQRRRAFQDLARFNVPEQTSATIYRVRHVRANMTLGGNGYVLSVGAQSLQIPAEAVAAVEWITQQSAFIAGEFEDATPDMSGELRADVLKTLSDAGLLDRMER